MSKELEYVEELKLKYQENGAIRRLNAIEKSLIAFEIIKNYIALNKSGHAYYICLNDEQELISKEDYNLLKEALK